MNDDPGNEFEPTADDIEELLVRFGARLPTTKIDRGRLRETLANAVGAHSRRDWIKEMVEAGAKLFPCFPEQPADEFELRLGQPGYDPAGGVVSLDDDEFQKRTVSLGWIELSHIVVRPQG